MDRSSGSDCSNNDLHKLITSKFADIKNLYTELKGEVQENKEGLEEAKLKIDQNCAEGKKRDSRIDKLEALVNDNRRRNARRILVISGHHLPRFTDEEDTEQVAIGAIKTVTGINVEKKSIANVHRQGKSKKIIFVEFSYTGIMREILNPKHRKSAHLKGIYLNIFQPFHDRKIGIIARRMKKAGLLHDSFSTLSGLTVAVSLEKREKFAINDLKDLERFAEAKGRTMSEFDFGMEDVFRRMGDMDVTK